MPDAPSSTRTTADRPALVLRGVEATLTGDSTEVSELFTADVHAAIPAPAWSAAALAVEIEDRRDVFTKVQVRLVHTRSVDAETWVEWAASVIHVGPFAIDDTVIEPTGKRVELQGITVAEFDGAKMNTFRQYWDYASLLGAADRPAHHKRPQRG